MTKIYTLNIHDGMDDNLFQALMAFLPEEKKEKVMRFYYKEDRLRSILSETLIRSIIIRELGISNKEIQYSCNEFGKPELEGRPDFHFNLSHSGDWVACAISLMPVGIDVEKVKPIDLGIAERFFTSRESAALFARSENERLNYFFRLWTLKESYIKAMGKGLFLTLDSFSILEDKYGGFYAEQEAGGPEVRIAVLECSGEYPMAVCSLDPDIDERVTVVRAIELGGFYE